MQPIPTWPGWYVGVVALFGALLVAIAVVDVRSRRIPNLATYPAIAAATLLAFLQPVGPWWSFIAAGLVVGAAFAALSLATAGLGMGDAKLAALVGLLLGWPTALAAVFVAFAAGAVAAIALLATGRIDRRQPVPFAPALALGTLVGLLGGPQLARPWWPFPA